LSVAKVFDERVISIGNGLFASFWSHFATASLPACGRQSDHRGVSEAGEQG
jgi:hypothetical protein